MDYWLEELNKPNTIDSVPYYLFLDAETINDHLLSVCTHNTLMFTIRPFPLLLSPLYFK